MNDTFRPWLARLLVVAGAATVVWVAADVMLGQPHRRQDEATLARMRAAPAPDRDMLPASLAIGEPIGTLEIPSVGLSGVVVEGDDASVLRYAIGHLPDTPLPWRSGNSALAGHRDSAFRQLEELRLGDILRLVTPYGTLHYRVRVTVIVGPDDPWVLDPTLGSTLTLISCYPCNYVGPAPTRFIVRADRIPTPYPTVLAAMSGFPAD